MDAPPSSPSPPLECARCLRALQPGTGDVYLVNILAVADPFPPIFSPEDLRRDPRDEINRLLHELRYLSADEALEQVYRRKTFYLCSACYRAWIEQPTGPAPAQGDCS